MAFYREHIVPRLIHLSMRQRQLEPYRRRLLDAAAGQVLEIGVGSGLNLAFYRKAAEHAIALDPSMTLLEMAARAPAVGPVSLVAASAERIPMANGSFDIVVTSWTLCSIPDPILALSEARRVLRPGGRLLFVEHGRAPEPSVRWWQDRLTPVWRRCSGGCHLNRAIPDLIEKAGLKIERMSTGYARGPRAMTFMYEGSARP